STVLKAAVLDNGRKSLQLRAIKHWVPLGLLPRLRLLIYLCKLGAFMTRAASVIQTRALSFAQMTTRYRLIMSAI
ncbi:MAG: hypothetical protein M0P52_14185, partial [Rhodoferax sp.]|nr:hypothetical protein [Rhodoferax sp.]